MLRNPKPFLDATRTGGFKVARNESYLSSVMTGLRFAVWWAPSTLLHAVKSPLTAALISIVVGILLILKTLFRLAAWVAFGVIMIILAFAGYLTPAPADINQR